MILRDLREYLETIPNDFDEYELCNGEVGYLDPTDETSAVYRLDLPIIAVYVDQDTKEVCFFHQTQQDVTKFLLKDDGDTENAE